LVESIQVNILLVNPKPRVWNAPRVPPLGLGYVAAALERGGHCVKIWDAVVDAVKPDFGAFRLVGATAVTPQVKEAWRVLGEAKSRGALTMIGGPHPTCLPEESIAAGVDFVVRQEGEETGVELAARLEKGGSVSGIAGITHRQDGRIVSEPDREPVRNLDSLAPPAHHLLPELSKYTSPQPLLSRRAPSLGIFTSRGCPFGCSFCFKGVFGRTFRPRSPGNVLAEWELLVRKYGAKEIAVQDDAFNIDVARAVTICRLVKERGLVVPWSTPNGIRADLATLELLTAMREAGCARTAFGVETGNAEVLARLDKRITLGQVEAAFANARKAGLKTMAFFMFGNPCERLEEMEDTIRFAAHLEPDTAQFTLSTPYPGTELREEVMRNGEMLEGDWEGFGHYTSRAFFRMGEVTPGLLRAELPRAYRRFYMRPARMAKMALDLETWKNIGNIAGGAWHLLARG